MRCVGKGQDLTPRADRNRARTPCARFAALGTEPVGGSIEQLREQIAREVPRWERLLAE